LNFSPHSEYREAVYYILWADSEIWVFNNNMHTQRTPAKFVYIFLHSGWLSSLPPLLPPIDIEGSVTIAMAVVKENLNLKFEGN
jgi:hypothetical protein